MAVVIGIDPHKQSHQAVAVDGAEAELARLEVRATKTQVDRLVRCESDWESRRLLTLETRMEHGNNKWWAA